MGLKATELRIGNCILFETKAIYEVSTIIGYDDELINIKHLSDKSDTRYSLGCSIKSKYLKTISLTEEWLLKLGLVFIETIQELKHYWLDDTGLFSIRESKYNNRAYDLIVHVRVDETVLIMSFDYVHEIQNYFALTGKELTIK